MSRLFLFFCIFITPSIQTDAKIVVLSRNLVDGKNVLTQDVFVDKGVDYHIIYGFDLDGKSIVLPENSTLYFEGNGYLSNGTLIGSNSDIKTAIRKEILDKIIIKGIWHVDSIFSTWFKFSDNADDNTSYLKSMCKLTDDNHYGRIFIDNGVYKVRASLNNENCLILNSNTDLIVNGKLLLEGNNLRKYSIINVEGKENINIFGKGSIVGDVNTHYGDEGEWGMGIKVMTSKNIHIKNIVIKNCWGDCIYLGQTSRTPDSFSDNVLIDNVCCIAGRRQGLSIIAGRNIIVRNCRFLNTGVIKYTPPGSGIDIEPNVAGTTTLDNISIENCVFRGNTNSDIKIFNTNIKSSVNIKKCLLERRIIFSRNSYNVDIDSCDIKTMIFNHGPFVNIKIRNSLVRDSRPLNTPSGVVFLNTKFSSGEKAMVSVIIGVFTMFSFVLLFRKKQGDRNECCAEGRGLREEG